MPIKVINGEVEDDAQLP